MICSIITSMICMNMTGHIQQGIIELQAATQ